DPVELVHSLRSGDNDERIGVDRTRSLDDPVDHATAQDLVEVLRRVGLHPRAETAGEHDSCWFLAAHGVDRIRRDGLHRLRRLDIFACGENAGPPGFGPWVTGRKPGSL